MGNNRDSNAVPVNETNETASEESIQISSEQLAELTNRLSRLEEEKRADKEKHELEMDTLRRSMSRNDNVNDDDVIESNHAQYRPLKIYVDKDGNEHPIIWTGGVKTETKYDEYRRPVVARQYIEVHVHGEKGIRKLNYSSDMSDPENYISLNKKPFKLVDQSEHDYNKTGASAVKPDQVIDNYGKIEIKVRDESSGLPTGTGKYVKGVSKTHKYEYTVLIGDEKVILDRKPE